MLRDEAPLTWPAFRARMETLIALRGPDLLRVKGLLNVAGCRGPVVFQAVQHLIHPPVELAAWPDKDHASRAGVHHPRTSPSSRCADLLGVVRALATRAELAKPISRRRVFPTPARWTSLRLEHSKSRRHAVKR